LKAISPKEGNIGIGSTDKVDARGEKHRRRHCEYGEETQEGKDEPQ